MEADKEGGFVIMPLGMFDAKANEAIKKNFKPSQDIPKKQKIVVLQLLKNRNLEQLRKAVNKAKKSYLDVFFTGKTHKPECPLRVIISERGYWQNEVSAYLQRILSKLTLQDPFLVRSSTELVHALAEGQLVSVTMVFQSMCKISFILYPSRACLGQCGKQ